MVDNTSELLLRIRLETCSLLSNRHQNSPFQEINDAKVSSAVLQTVVGRVVSKKDGSQLLVNFGEGQRVCCSLHTPLLSYRNLPEEVDVSPYTACLLSNEIDSGDCAATLSPAIRIYTAFHTLARVRKGDLVLIACPNDLNFTCLATQICRIFDLKPFAFVADESAAAIFRDKTAEKHFLNLDNIDLKLIMEACDSFTGSLGFDCILDIGNHFLEPSSSPPINLSKLTRLLAAFGHIITDRKDSIAASEVNILHMTSGNLHFLNDQLWQLSPMDCGKYRHILSDIIQHLKNGKLKPVINLQVDARMIEEAITKYDDKIGVVAAKFYPLCSAYHCVRLIEYITNTGL